MKDRLSILAHRFAAARADVDAEQREIRRASARRLAELQRGSDGKALVAGLKDPALTVHDREQLARTIAERLPKARTRAPQSLLWTIHHAARQVRYRWRALIIVLFVIRAKTQ